MNHLNHRTVYGAPLAVLAFAFLGAGNAQASGDELVLLPDWKTLLVLVAFFSALVFPMNALLFKPILQVLDAREARTAGTRKRAEQLVADAEAMLERYEASLREVRQDAEEARKQTLATARRDGSATTAGARGAAESEVARARNEITTALDQARVVLKTQSAVLASEVAERALGRPLS